MGQKTHPNGFRIGITKTHNSTWFESYGNYKNILREDYQIRQLFEQEWRPFYTKAGIVKLEIKRKINQLEYYLVVYRMIEVL